MLKITNDCIKCGRCAEDCPAHVIALRGEQAKPELISQGCILCGHCEAICPKNALQNTLMESDTVLPFTKTPILDPENAELFLRSRRSARCFKPGDVPKALTEKLLDIGRYAQTGGNTQSVSYMVLSEKTMVSFRKLVNGFFANHPNTMVRDMFISQQEAGYDMVFRQAPMVILALTPKDNAYIANNARYALTYIELLAPSLELGTCWAGFLEQYTGTDDPEMRKLLNIPDGLQISGALLYGVPKYKYYRTAKRKKCDIHWN